MIERKSLVEAIANAPGTIQAPDVQARVRAIEHQFRHDNTLVPLAPSSGQQVEIVAVAGSSFPLEGAAIFYTTDGSQPTESSPCVSMAVKEVTWDSRTGYVTNWSGDIPPQPRGTTVRYRIGGWREGSGAECPDAWAQDGSGFWFRSEGTSGITTFSYETDPPANQLPAWMDSAVIYQIFVDRFHPGTADGKFPPGLDGKVRHGGTLAGICRSLPYLADLGVSCIWLSPIHPSDTYHRYDTKDYFGIDPALGTESEFRALVDEAHASGIRVLLDFVPSHSSWKHPAFLAAQADRSAPTSAWYTFEKWPNDYRCFLQVSKHLPSINTQDPGARRHLIDAARHWITEFGVDGFRLDHTIGAGMDFWVEFQQAIVSARPDVVTIAEATDTPDYLRHYRGRVNCVLDFELAAMLRMSFGQGDIDLQHLDTFVKAYEEFMGSAPARVSFLDNHDMDRFLWIAGNDRRRLQLAALCQFTLPPTPAIYYGTEIGLAQERSAGGLFGGDEEARRDMLWDPQQWDEELHSFYRSLIRIRKETASVWQGSRSLLKIDAENGFWAYLCTASNVAGGKAIVVTLNLGEQSQEFELPAKVRAVEPLLTVGSVAEPDSRRLRFEGSSASLLLSL